MKRPGRRTVDPTPCKAKAAATSGDTFGSLRASNRCPASPLGAHRATATASFNGGYGPGPPSAAHRKGEGWSEGELADPGVKLQASVSIPARGRICGALGRYLCAR